MEKVAFIVLKLATLRQCKHLWDYDDYVFRGASLHT